MTNPTSSTLRLRADLLQRRVLMGTQTYWVLKDPLSREFYYFSDREFAILQMLDGRRTLSEIRAACESRFAPDFISSDVLVGFLADAQRKGLLIGPRGKVATSDSGANRRRWWHQPLAVRFPGINPDRLLTAIGPWLAPLLTPVAAIVAMIMVLASCLLVATNFEAFAEHLQIAATRPSANGLIALVIVISATKIIHELAHAVVCKRFGGECREIGVMLLVGVPCLYCDVSDAWMLPQRWKRIGISLAGMAAELQIASIATFVWLLTADGIVRDICVTVMVVCSVTTVLFNGNPLLRYDGYFVLSDLTGIPNLAGESTSLIRERLRHFVWAAPSYRLSYAGSNSIRRNCFLIGYGVSSGIYRMVVYGCIFLVLYRMAESYELEKVVGFLLLAAVAALAVKWVKSILTPPPRAVGGISLVPRRPVFVCAIALAVILLAASLPLPHNIVAPMSVRPADAQTVFVSVPGQIIDSIDEGHEVADGQLIAKLTNPETERERLQGQGTLRNLQTELDGLRGRRASDRQAATRIPVLAEAITVTRQRLDDRITESERLNLRSPQRGAIFAPPRKQAPMDEHNETQTWSGTPLSPRNLGAWLEEGTVLCEIGDSSVREALVLVRQQDIPLVRVGQQVTFLLPDHRRGQLRGRVIEVATSPVDEVPIELSATGLIPPAPRGNGPTYYQVRIAIETADIALPIRTTGQVRINVGTASLAARIGRFLSESFL